jgi:chromate transporter
MAGGTLPWIAAAFHGLQPAVIALIVAAIWRMFFRNVTSHALRVLVLTSFLAMFFLKTPFFIIIVAAAGVGMILGRMNREEVGSKEKNEPASNGKLGFAPVILCVAWWMPVLLAAWLGTWNGFFAQMGVFFSKVSLLTFGGAYAILPYVSQVVVADWKWLTESQMIAGLGLAETTPGPLIMVLQFVGFTAAWQNPGTLSPLIAGTLGAAMTTWTTFLPAFVLVLTGAPFMERIRQMAVLRNALSGISAAVVGVMLNLAVWLGLHVFRPETESWDWTSLVLSVGFLVLFEKGKFSVPLGVLLAGVIGILRWAAWGA